MFLSIIKLNVEIDRKHKNDFENRVKIYKFLKVTRHKKKRHKSRFF